MISYRKQRSTTIQFLLGACFFVYLPLLPLLIVFCNWRRRRLARKRLRKKAERKKKRLLQVPITCYYYSIFRYNIAEEASSFSSYSRANGVRR